MQHKIKIIYLGRKMSDRGEGVAGVGNQETCLSNRTIAHRHTLDES